MWRMVQFGTRFFSRFGSAKVSPRTSKPRAGPVVPERCRTHQAAGHPFLRDCRQGICGGGVLPGLATCSGAFLITLRRVCFAAAAAFGAFAPLGLLLAFAIAAAFLAFFFLVFFGLVFLAADFLSDSNPAIAFSSAWMRDTNLFHFFAMDFPLLPGWGGSSCNAVVPEVGIEPTHL